MALDGSALLGLVHKAYIEPDADLETPVWAELDQLQGLNKAGALDVSEVKERASLFTLVLTGHEGLELQLTLTRRPGDTLYDALEAAFQTRSKIGVAAMTGDITTPGERGVQFEGEIVNWDDDQAHESNAVSCTIRPSARYTTPPAYVEIAGP